MRTIHTDEIIKNIKEMCIEANLSLTEDMKCRFKNATESEKSPLGKQILNQLQENMEIAAADQIPICQDTGMAIVFLNIGQDVHIEGMDLHDAVNEGVRQGYTEGYLRKSVVKDPLIRENTKDSRRRRRCEEICHSGGQRCGSQCLSTNGCRSWTWRKF